MAIQVPSQALTLLWFSWALTDHNKQEPFRSYKKVRAVLQIQSSKMGKLDDVPMRLKIKTGVSECKKIKILCTDANSNICKEELPVITYVKHAQ